ncbi:hypothetical protein GQ44DRAFT_771959 [Phaeosphaeriaceae sp. PMI808]|nr:hypothetical protein GQ44DRAFT_771959 [Phaeosphaeriaceae sp. PMI808]
MGNHDSSNIRSSADILLRQSRPQRNSTWVPKSRDWRYATAVYQHDDFDDGLHSRSVWDTLDYDYHTTASVNSQKSRNNSDTECEVNFQETTVAIPSPKSRVARKPTELSETLAQAEGSHKLVSPPQRSWSQVTKFKRSEESVEEGKEANYKPLSLIVRLNFTGKNKLHVQQLLEQHVQSPLPPVSLNHTRFPAVIQNPTPPYTPISVKTGKPICTAYSINSPRTFPLLERTWIDETHDFNITLITSSLRLPGAPVNDLGPNYGWYTNAVPIDAIFPPGVPISAKEINAYYPHHVRWKSVMMRLANNGYKGADIMGIQNHFRGPPNHPTTPTNMNTYQREALGSTISGHTLKTHKPVPDRNLHTTHLTPDTHIQTARNGHSLPTFAALVDGLHNLPSGLDARGLTYCLSWYLSVRHTFTPPLDLNVLHTQSLLRALRHPLKPFGPQNLDCNALHEWRENGCAFEAAPVEHRVRIAGDNNDNDNDNKKKVDARQSGRSRLCVDVGAGKVGMVVRLPVRRVFMFPFMAMQGVVAEAFRLGIRRAEERRGEREGRGKEGVGLGLGGLLADGDGEGDEVSDGGSLDMAEVARKPYRIPKRARSVEGEGEAAVDKRPCHLGKCFSMRRDGNSSGRARRSRDSVYGRR